MPQLLKIITEISQAINKAGGRVFLAGGCVRDIVLKQKPADYDLEVYFLRPGGLKKILNKFSRVSEVGKAFGIFKLITKHGEIDVALPRRDSKVRSGHRGFKIKTDPNLDFKQAASRRDFTINSMLLDPLTGKIIDPLGGLGDLRKKILRVASSRTFAEDPLRVLRAMQLVGRFALNVEPKSKKIIKKIAPSLNELSGERIWLEWRKLLLKSDQPSFGLQAALELDILKTLAPQFIKLSRTPQNPEWHAEGNVWTHTKKAADNAADLARREKLSDKDRLILLLSACCHDLGKGLVTRKIDGRWRSIGHAKAGEGLVKNFLTSINVPKSLRQPVLGLAIYHMKPLNSALKKEDFSDGWVRNLAGDLAKYKTNIYLLGLQATADVTASASPKNGQIVWPKSFPQAQKILKRAESLGVAFGPPPPIISGLELIKLGFKQGRNIGQAIKAAGSLRDKGLSKKEILKLIGKITNQRSEKSAILELEKQLAHNN